MCRIPCRILCLAYVERSETRSDTPVLTEAKVLIERWRRAYNTVRPHSALGYRPPASEAVRPVSIGGCNGFNMSASPS